MPLPHAGPQDVIAVAEHVRFRLFDDEVVLLDLKGGDYFALNEVGARMWQALAAGHTPAEVAATVATEYGADQDAVLGDCLKLVDELLDRRLVLRAGP